MRSLFIVIAAVVSFSTTADARHCPQDMAQIDAALKTAQLSPAERAEVEKLRKQGEELHNAGNHPASEERLAKAKEMLNIK